MTPLGPDGGWHLEERAHDLNRSGLLYVCVGVFVCVGVQRMCLIGEMACCHGTARKEP